jgi:uncharacterized protein YgbK (DUF1537 family)
MTIFIYADDLTGALDTGVHFTGAGFSVRVSEDLASLALDKELPLQVSIWNGCSRHLSTQEAGSQAEKAALFFKEEGFTHYYHKVDSTLRGNCGVELFSAMGVLNRSVHFLPAYPHMGRTVEGGTLFVHGVSLEKSPMAEDSLNPAETGYIPHILSRQSPIKVNLLAQGTPLCSGEEAQVNLYDGTCHEDLRQNFRNWEGEPLFLSGSGGLAKAWCEVLAEEWDLTRSEQKLFPPLDMLINGSANPRTTQQWEILRKKGNKNPFTIPLTFLENRSGKEENNYLQTILSSEEKPLLFTLPPMIDSRGTAEEDCLDISEQYAAFLSSLIGIKMPESIMVIGGDTLVSLIKALDIRIMIPLYEYEPGIILSKIETDRVPELMYIYSKSGGFGEPDLLLNITKRENDSE